MIFSVRADYINHDLIYTYIEKKSSEVIFPQRNVFSAYGEAFNPLGNLEYSLHLIDLRNTQFFNTTKLRPAYCFKVQEHCDKIRDIGEIGKFKKGPLSDYQCFLIKIKNLNLAAYEIGLGAHGTFVQIYDKDKQIGTIKQILPHHFKNDLYTVYLSSADYFNAIKLFLSCYDRKEHYRNLHETGTIAPGHPIHTKNKLIKSKYDANFIPSIKSAIK